ncbi:MAG: helix-turn-helix domain-containing protein [Candidatus Dojkabacteria bacterium]
MINEAVGTKIRKFRTRAGMSQLDLELEIGTSSGSISRIESGSTNPTKETILKIASVFNLGQTDTAALFGIEGVSTSYDFVEVEEEISNVLDPNELYKLMTNRIVNKLGVRYSSIWKWQSERKVLALKSVHAPSKLIALVEKITNAAVSKLEYYPLEPKYESNLIARAFRKNETTIAKEFNEISPPYVTNRVLNNTMQRLLGMKYSVSSPIRFRGDPIGVFGIIWADSEIPNDLLGDMNLLASQFGRAIHNAEQFQDLQHRIVRLEEKVNN